MPSWTSRDIIKRLRAEGWVSTNTEGSHVQFTHPTKSGKVTVQHPRKDLRLRVVKSIFAQAGWDWRSR